MLKKLQSVLLALAMFLGVAAVAFGQTANGVVVDAQGQPVPGASIIVKGTTTGTMTLTDGTFTLAARPGSLLEVSCIGYATKDVPAGVNLRIVLAEDDLFLDESVVTALGISRERKSLGYSVSEVKSEELMKNKQANVVNSLAGKVPGVNVTQSSGAAGADDGVDDLIVVKLLVLNIFFFGDQFLDHVLEILRHCLADLGLGVCGGRHHLR